ncbi:MAG: SpvB/TcaC N-terminal domain-containing protein, partial [Myxococcota bacterium]
MRIGWIACVVLLADVASAQLLPEFAEELPEEVREDLREALPAEFEELDPEVRERLADAAELPAEEVPADAEPVSLPTGTETKSAVEPSRISLPSAEASVEGMGESFTPNLSSGTGTFSVPIALPEGRNGVQPSLSLAYSTGGGNSAVGFGWNMGAPFIARQTDRG